MMDAAYWASQKQVVAKEIQNFLAHDLENKVCVDEKELHEHIDEIYPVVSVAGNKYNTSLILKEVDEVAYKEFKNAYEEDICLRIKEAVCDVLDNESGEVVDDYLPFALKNLLRQYVSICSNLYRSDN